MEKTYVIAGAGYRCYGMFAKYLDEQKNAKIAGVYDTNPHRSEYYKKNLKTEFKIYDDFDIMLKETKPDYAIITCIDSMHHCYIEKALAAGVNVICEKPLTTDLEKCESIYKTVCKYPDKKFILTFNLRYSPYLRRIKELIESGEIGEIYAVNYEYLLDYSHGADYFRRWHAQVENSGGMLVHKSTHHFDIANWWLNDAPESVSAACNLVHFGKNGKFSSERCLTCPHSESCRYHMDISKDKLLRELYMDGEKHDGYLRDKCVFSKDADIWDNMSVSVKYSKGAILTYKLTMFNEYEGYKISVTGSKGRIEACDYYSGLESGDKNYNIKIFKDGECKEIAFSKAEGNHGGGDIRLLRDIFSGKESMAAPDINDAVKSALIGICATESAKKGVTVDIGTILNRLKI